MNRQPIKLILMVILTTAFLHGPAASNTEAAELKGIDIMTRADNLESGEDSHSYAIFELINKRGRKRVRKTMRFFKDYKGKSGFDSKMITFFQSPPDVKGTGFLSWTYADESKDDKQWLYLSALRRVRRIASSSQDDNFMGTDFTYDDLGDRKISEDTHRLLKSDTLNGTDCYVVESVPKKKDYIYSKKRVWVDKKNWLVLKVDFYDRKDRLLKTLNTEWQQLDDLWTWKESKMENHLTGHSTVISVKKVMMNADLEDKHFNERSLKRGIKCRSCHDEDPKLD